MKTWKKLAILTAMVFSRNDLHALPSAAPGNGSTSLQLIQPQLIEVETIVPFGSRDTDGLPNYLAQITNGASYQISAGGQTVNCVAAGIQRRPTYAAMTQWDLRLRVAFYLKTGTPIAETNALSVAINIPGFWQTNLTAQLAVTRTNPAIHVSEAGYAANLPKRAMVGYFLGTLGEMPALANTFQVVNAATGLPAYSGTLTPRLDTGFASTAYHNVLEANFDNFTNCGVYRIYVPGMGESEPFRVGAEFGALLTRTYALGLLNQRCGMAVGLPDTRFSHDACHTRPALVPTTNYATFQIILSNLNAGVVLATNEIRMTNLQSCLFPYINTNAVNVTGGHHDAGDYSKYTPNCASLANDLIFAVDNFPGVNQLDNLGIPESGDGIPDLLQEAKWETDYIIKLQDADGGFYSIVYPENRQYEVDCLPEQGDNQLVYPKTTTATAASVAILAKAASSPVFKHYYPATASNYLTAALKGWAFLTNAYAQYGQDGASQQVKGSYYGQKDNLAWAYAELYLATTNQMFHNLLRAYYTPGDPNTCHWSWWHMDLGYGRAVRAYAFAAKNGRVDASLLDPAYLALCNQEITNWSETVTEYAQQSAYGSSFPWESKHMNASGWYFSSGEAFDIATGLLLQNNPNWWAALVSNLAYEAGCNPLNQSYVNGIGGRRYHNVVSQYTWNDKRQVAVTGVPIGNIQTGFVAVNNYPFKALTLPGDGNDNASCPMYDRGGDTPDVLTEPTGMDQAKALAVSALLMGQSSYLSQPWVPATNGISLVTESSGNILCTLQSAVTNLNGVEPVWESFGNPLGDTTSYEHQVLATGDQWIEAEYLLPDGRRLCAANTFPASAPAVSGLETVSVSTIYPVSYLGVRPGGLIRISRDRSPDTLSVNFHFSGARNGVDCAWLNASSFASSWGVATLPPGTNTFDIPVLAAMPPDDYSTKQLVVTVAPGNFNLSYPNYASVTIVRTNVSGVLPGGATNGTTTVTNTNTTTSTNTVTTPPATNTPPAVASNTIPAYVQPAPLANPPSLGVPAAVIARMTAATIIDYYLFNDATNSRTAAASLGNLPPLQLTNATPGNCMLKLADWTSIATNVCTLSKGTNLHGLVFKTSLYITNFNSYGHANANLFSVYQNWYCYLQLYEDKWATSSIVRGAYQTNVASQAVLSQYLTKNTWHDFVMQLDTWGYVIYVDGAPVAALPSTDLNYWHANYPVIVNVGQFGGALRKLEFDSY